MTDAKLRELEREWKRSGSTEAEAAFLLERVRVGELSADALEAAASLGHAGARAARVMLGEADVPTIVDPLMLLEMSSPLPASRPAAALAAARALLVVVEGGDRVGGWIREILESAEECLHRPSAVGIDRVVRAVEQALAGDHVGAEFGMDLTCAPECCWPAQAGCVVAALDAAMLVAGSRGERYDFLDRDRVADLTAVVRYSCQGTRVTLDHVRDAIRSRVIKWALCSEGRR